MSKFLKKYYIDDDKVKLAEFELTDLEVALWYVYNPGQQLPDDPSYTVPVIFLPDSMHKKTVMDFGDDPVVVNL